MSAPLNLPERKAFPDQETPSILGVLEQMSTLHKAQLSLCNRLEDLADNLPDRFNSQTALIIARQIGPTIKQAHQFEEKTLFTLLPADEERTKQSLERLKFEHWEDEASAEDLADALISYARDAKPELAGKLAYMLRGFFDNLRRHIAFESEHILPLIAQN